MDLSEFFWDFETKDYNRTTKKTDKSWRESVIAIMIINLKYYFVVVAATVNIAAFAFIFGDDGCGCKEATAMVILNIFVLYLLMGLLVEVITCMFCIH